MRIGVAVLLSAVYALEPTGHEACRYIGARLAKTNSECLPSGKCSNVFLDIASNVVVAAAFTSPSSSNVNLTCEQAQSITQEVIQDNSVDRVVPQITLDDVQTCFYFIIVKGLKHVLLHELLLPQLVVEAMTDLNAFINTAIADSWDRRAELLSRLSRDMRILNRVMDSILRRCMSSPHEFDTHRGLYGEVVNFWLDLASLFPEVNLPPAVTLIPLSLQAATNKPVHRERYELEALFSLGWTFTPSHAVAFAKSIDSISYKLSKGRGPITSHEIEQLEILYSSFPTFSAATNSMLKYMTRRGVCPFISTLVIRICVETELPPSVIVKLGVTLISACRGLSSQNQLMAASITLGHLWMNVPRNQYVEASPWEEVIYNPDHPWISGFFWHFEEKVVSMRDFVFITLGGLVPVADLDVGQDFNMFRLKSNSASSANYSQFARSMGRTIGYSLREDIDLKVLKLHPVIVKMLHNPTAGLSASFTTNIPLFARPASHILEAVLETITLVREGIVETLGPGAFECFEENAFIQFFLPYLIVFNVGTIGSCP